MDSKSIILPLNEPVISLIISEKLIWILYDFESDFIFTQVLPITLLLYEIYENLLFSINILYHNFQFLSRIREAILEI